MLNIRHTDNQGMFGQILTMYSFTARVRAYLVFSRQGALFAETFV